jgi:putative endonuclease
VYVVECVDGSLYCGITTDVLRRFHEHNSTKRAAKYTRSRRPVYLVFQSHEMLRSDAASIEAKFKKLRVDKKRKLISDIKMFNDHFGLDDTACLE